MAFKHRALALSLTLLLASCASLIGPREVEIPLSKLQAGLDRRFPLHNKVMSLLDIDLTHPQLALLPESQRVALTMDVSVAPPFVRQSWHGTLSLSGRLVADLSRNAVVLSETHVDRVAIDGVDDERQRQFGQAANVVVDKLLRDISVHDFRPEDLHYAGVQFVPTGIVVKPDALVVNVAPVK